MTAKELLYLELLNDICNTEYTENDMPAGFELAIDKCILEEGNFGYKSKSTQDLGITLDKSTVIDLTSSYIYMYMRQRW